MATTDVSARVTDGVRAPVLATKFTWMPEMGLVVCAAGSPALQTTLCASSLFWGESRAPQFLVKNPLPLAIRCLLVRPAAEAVLAVREPRLSWTRSDIFNLVVKNIQICDQKIKLAFLLENIL